MPSSNYLCVLLCVSNTDSSYRDMSALSAGGVAMSVPLGIPMFTRPKDTVDGVNQGVRLQVSKNLCTSAIRNNYTMPCISL